MNKPFSSEGHIADPTQQLRDNGLVPSSGRALFNEQQQAALVEYWRIAVRWKWYVAACIAGALVIGLLVSLLSTPLYTATSRIEIAREGNKIVNVDSVSPESSEIDQEFYQTQYGLLESEALANAVVGALRVQDDPAFFDMFGTSLEEASVPESGRQLSNVQARQQRRRVAAEILLENLSVSPVAGSRLVDISITSPNPEFSRKAADAWATNFIESNLARKFEATSFARSFLERRLSELRARLEDSERTLVNYASNQRIINLPAPRDLQGGAGEQRSIVADDLAALNEALNTATAERIAAQTRWTQSSRAGRGSSPEALRNNALTALRERRAAVAAEYAKLLAQFEPEYPAAQALSQQVAQLDRSIGQEEARVQESLRGNYLELAAREDTLRARVEGLKSGMIDLRRRSIQYNIFQREVDTNRQLYDGLLQRYKEIGLAGGVGSNNILIVDKALLPETPSFPNPIVNMLLALIAGTFLGGLLAFVLDQMDDSINDPAQVSNALGVPNLGTIPRIGAEEPTETLMDPKSELNDAYLSLRTTLQYATSTGVPKTLVVTSTRASEGKSTTAYAIALTLSRLNRSVLLIDGDMRSPSVHDIMSAPNGDGLSDILSSDRDAATLVHPAPMAPGLFFMTAGVQPPNAAELLTGTRFGSVIEQLAGQFDHVVVDAPPVMGLADAPLIASSVQSTIYVIGSHGTRVAMARNAINRLLATNARIIGTVVTMFDLKKSPYGYGYEYGYGYGKDAKAG